MSFTRYRASHQHRHTGRDTRYSRAALLSLVAASTLSVMPLAARAEGAEPVRDSLSAHAHATGEVIKQDSKAVGAALKQGAHRVAVAAKAVGHEVATAARRGAEKTRAAFRGSTPS